LNKSEIAAAEAQASLRVALSRMSAAVRSAGSGGLFVTQSVLAGPDPDLPGISISGGDFDNVSGGAVSTLSGGSVPIRPGTDVLDVRGAVFSPLLGFDDETGCGPCSGLSELTVRAVTARGLVNHEPAKRPQFSEIDDRTQSASATHPWLVVVAAAGEREPPCVAAGGRPAVRPQPPYRVGLLAAPTALAAAGTFGWIDFDNPIARELATEDPGAPAAPGPDPLPAPIARAGLLDDVVFFVDDSDPAHPVLARGVRRGARFDVVALADDVEDLQVAYGVDGLYAGDSVSPDGSVGRLVATTPDDPDPDASTVPDGDEWAPNVPGERVPLPGDFEVDRCPRLRAVMLSAVVRSHDPDPSYLGPDSRGVRTLNSAVASSPPRYRRRSQTIRVALRAFGDGG
jgi:hypothetical protein